MVAAKAVETEQEKARARRDRIAEIRRKLPTAEGEMKRLYEEALKLFLEAEQQYQEWRRRK